MLTAKEFLEVFDRRRGKTPVMASSGISGAIWRFGHRDPTLYNTGMSYTTPACLGLALARPDLDVLAIEGDGSMLMGLAGLATVGRYEPPNLVVVVFNNRTYLPTGTTGELVSAAAFNADLVALARAAGISRSIGVDTAAAFDTALIDATARPGPVVIVAEVELERDTWLADRSPGDADRAEMAARFLHALPERTSLTAMTGSAVPNCDAMLEIPEIELHEPGWRASARLHWALKSAGVDLAVYLPEGTLYPLQVLIERDPEMFALCCTREDEGVAIASGAAYGGHTPAVVMEGTGTGMSVAALAGLITRRTPTLIVSSHSECLGMRNPWDEVAVLSNEPILRALGLQTTVLKRLDDAEVVMRESVRAMKVMKRPVAVVIPPYLMDDS